MPGNRKPPKGASNQQSRNCSQESTSDLSQEVHINDVRKKSVTREHPKDSPNLSPRKMSLRGSNSKEFENSHSPKSKNLNLKRSNTRASTPRSEIADASDADSFTSSQNEQNSLSPQPPKRQKTITKNVNDSPRRKSSRLNKDDCESMSSQEIPVELHKSACNNNMTSSNDLSRKRKCSGNLESYSEALEEVFQKAVLKDEILKHSLPTSKRLKQSSINTNGVEPVFQETNTTDDFTNNNIQKSHRLSNSPGFVNREVILTDTDWTGWSDGENLTDKDPLMERVWRFSDSPTKKSDSRGNCPEKHFSLLSYNIYCSTSDNIGGKKNLNDSRHKLLLKEISHINADIICLQDVNQYYYDRIFKKDIRKNCAGLYAENGHSTGLAIFYNESKFQQLHYEVIDLPDTVESIISELSAPQSVKLSLRNYLNVPRQMQVLILQNVLNKNVYLIANVQAGSLTKKENDLLSVDISCTQICGALWKISEIMNERVPIKLKKVNKEHDIMSWVLCGDFAASVDSPVYQICRDGYPSDHSLSILQKFENITIPGYSEKQALVNILWRAFQHPLTDLLSCYRYVLGREPPLTMKDENLVGCNDFIWTNSHATMHRPLAVLLPRCSYIRNLKNALPNDKFPSKHTSLACKFSVS